VRLGSTLDDAVGEAFDKVARDLELPWSVDGAVASPGAALEALAATGIPQPPLLPLAQAFLPRRTIVFVRRLSSGAGVGAGDASRIQPPLPIPMRNKPSQRRHCDFSFAGLKAA